MSLQEALLYLASGNGAAVAVSWVLEQIPQFHALSSRLKWSIYVALTVGLSVGSYAVLQYVPQEAIAALAPWFVVIYGAATSVWVGQKFHSGTKST